MVGHIYDPTKQHLGYFAVEEDAARRHGNLGKKRKDSALASVNPMLNKDTKYFKQLTDPTPLFVFGQAIHVAPQSRHSDKIRCTVYYTIRWPKRMVLCYTVPKRTYYVTMDLARPER